MFTLLLKCWSCVCNFSWKVGSGSLTPNKDKLVLILQPDMGLLSDIIKITIITKIDWSWKVSSMLSTYLIITKFVCYPNLWKKR